MFFNNCSLLYFFFPEIYDKHKVTPSYYLTGASLVAQMVKNLPVMQQTQVQSLGQENSVEKGMAIHSSILAWRILWRERPGGLQFMGLQRVRHN